MEEYNDEDWEKQPNKLHGTDPEHIRGQYGLGGASYTRDFSSNEEDLYLVLLWMQTIPILMEP